MSSIPPCNCCCETNSVKTLVKKKSLHDKKVKFDIQQKNWWFSWWLCEQKIIVKKRKKNIFERRKIYHFFGIYKTAFLSFSLPERKKIKDPEKILPYSILKTKHIPAEKRSSFLRKKKKWPTFIINYYWCLAPWWIRKEQK